ncbi:MAG: adenylate/guanylate cyclase domain-containing protein [Methylovulum miyakonense]|uniref:adenylate/guanylate cyclase domain-containing protein n=1 Tax=Methylovulum miyakonense TaxID=645578 RepID=UPI003BB6F7B8
MPVTVKFFRPFRQFRSRLLFYTIGLLLLALAGVVAVVNQVFRDNTEAAIRHELLVTERIFLRLLSERSQQLTQQATALASDFAFKRVIATQDQDTLTSALVNLGARVQADAAFLVSIDDSVLANSLDPQQNGQLFFAQELLAQAEAEGAAARLMLIGKTPYQLIIVPVLAPEPIVWLCLGFVIDNTVLAQLKQLTQVEISLLSEQGQTLQIQASTLAPSPRQQLPLFQTDADGFFWHTDKDLYLSRLVVLENQQTGKLIALIERSWPKALENFYRLQWLLLLIALLSIGLASLAAAWLAKTVSKPLQTLARGVQAIGLGNYGYQVQIHSQDEMGQLGMAFNAMGTQLLEKEKIRTLLGKVVSPVVATELLSHDVVLGGETREITALFTDLAGFTSIAEQMPPQALVALLNGYLTEMSSQISRHHGVLDKFIGDAIVAFWGAPVADAGHAQQAVHCALAMQHALRDLRTIWRQQGLPLLSMRIGINTGDAVVGNIGSIDRLDYTMIGDTVNLAARLEGANKYYGSEILISEQTYQQVCSRFACRELDTVRVQGKQQHVAIYEVIARHSQLTPEQHQLCLNFADALAAFRQRQFPQAKILFTGLVASFQDKPSALYLQRLEELAAQEVSADFDAVYDLAK